MARKRKPEHVNHERWLVSYADFITLLFAFFVVLYASSQADKSKMAKLSVAIQTAFSEMGTASGQSAGAPVATKPSAVPATQVDTRDGSETRSITPVVIETDSGNGRTESVEKLKRELEAALAEELKRKEVALTDGPDGLIISLREVGFFRSGSAAMRDDARPAFERIVSLLRQHEFALRLEGHTDVVPIHTAMFQSNWELSTSRATAVVKDLVSRYSFPPEKLAAAGYAEFHPVADNATEEGRKLNRRVDLVVLQPKQFLPPPINAAQKP